LWFTTNALKDEQLKAQKPKLSFLAHGGNNNFLFFFSKNIISNPYKILALKALK
jgi:hypothetical protein